MYTITEESPAAGVLSAGAAGAALASLTVTAALVPSNVIVTVEPSFATSTFALAPPLDASPSRFYSPLSQAWFVRTLNS